MKGFDQASILREYKKSDSAIGDRGNEMLLNISKIKRLGHKKTKVSPLFTRNRSDESYVEIVYVARSI